MTTSIQLLNGDANLSRAIETIASSQGLNIRLISCESIDDVRGESGVIWVWRATELEIAHFFHLQVICRRRNVIVLLDVNDPYLIQLVRKVGVLACFPIMVINEQLPPLLAVMSSPPQGEAVREMPGIYAQSPKDAGEQASVYVDGMVAQVAWETPDFFVLIGMDKHLIYMNRTARLLMGIALDASVDALDFGHFHKPEIKQFIDETIVPTLTQNGTWIGEQVLKMFGGIEIPALFVVTLNKDSDGKPAFISVIARDIRKVKAAEKKVSESREVVDRFLDVSPMAVRTLGLHPPYKMTTITSNVTRILGYEPSALIETYSDWMVLVHPDDINLVKDAIGNLQAKEKVEVAYRLQHANGTYRWLQEQLTLHVDTLGRPQEIFGYFWDITEKQIAIESLSISETRFRTMAEVSKDFIYSVDMFGRFDYVNPAVCELFELPEDAIIGKPYADFFEGAERSFPGLALPGGLDKKWPEYSETLIHVNGKEMWIGTWLSMVVNPTGEPHIQGISRDITSSIEKGRELTEAYSQARRTSLIRSRIVSVVTRQFQKPLSEIVALVDGLIERYSKGDGAQRQLTQIQQYAQRMLIMLESVIAFDVSESIQQATQNQNYELMDFIEKICEKVKSELGVKRKIQINSNASVAPIAIDQTKLRQIIEPIIRNALMYSDSTKNVEIEIIDGQDYTVVVRDYGLGIAPEDLPLIFEPFFRGANILEHSGIGLDLPLAKNAAEILGADIQVKSTQGIGTTVTICIPKQ